MSNVIQLHQSHSSITEHLQQVETLMNRLALSSSSHNDERGGEMLVEHLATGGKRIRAQLALSGAEALGVPAQKVVSWAAAVELLHNATLIHDDIQDGDETRRGQPTVWAKHGVAQAINAGDLALMLPFLALPYLQTDDSTRWTLSWWLAEAAAKTVRGQVEELDLFAKGDLSRDSYFRCVSVKTGGLLSLPLEGALLLAGFSASEARTVGLSIQPLGVVFQLQDDVLDLYADKGRSIQGSDIAEGKVSALVVEHVALCPFEREWLLSVLRLPRESTTTEHISQVTKRFEDSGALDAVLKNIQTLAHQLRNDPVLSAHPSIHQLVINLLKRIITPIQPVLKQRGFEEKGLRLSVENGGASVRV